MCLQQTPKVRVIDHETQRSIAACCTPEEVTQEKVNNKFRLAANCDKMSKNSARCVESSCTEIYLHAWKKYTGFRGGHVPLVPPIDPPLKLHSQWEVYGELKRISLGYAWMLLSTSALVSVLSVADSCTPGCSDRERMVAESSLCSWEKEVAVAGDA